MQHKTKNLHLIFLKIFFFSQAHTLYDPLTDTSDNDYDFGLFLDTSEAQQPVLNGTFILKCIIAVNDNKRKLFFDWDYPRRNNTDADNFTEILSISRWNSEPKRYEVTSSLHVQKVKSNDTGQYICTVKDDMFNTWREEVNISMYNSEQPAQVNFTTDINVTEPVAYQIGSYIRFVIAVHAFPCLSQVELYWEKDGTRLVSGHYRFKLLKRDDRHSTAVLEIKQLQRSDAGIYNLCGKTYDGLTNITIRLKIEILPGFPEIEGYREGDILKDGDILRLTCTVRSDNPRMEIAWTRNNIKADDSYSIRGREVKNVHISRVNAMDDNAVYQCEAATDLMEYWKIARLLLSVQHNPVVSLVNEEEEKIYLKDQRYSLECHVESNTLTQIQWLRQPFKQFQLCIDDEDEDWETLYNDDGLPNDEHMVTFANIGRQTSWISHLNVTAREPGCYMCVARNSAGRNTAIVLFNVEVHTLYDSVTDTSQNHYDFGLLLDASEAQGSLVYDTFILKCIITVDSERKLFFDWDYPGRNNIDNRFAEMLSVFRWNSEPMRYEIISSLQNQNARLNDTGQYICTVKDDMLNTWSAAVNLSMYMSYQSVHVSFTTDINITQPVVYQIGSYVTFVIEVYAFRSISDVELYWLKDEILTASHKYRFKLLKRDDSHSTAVLEIKQLRRSDAGIYSLCARTYDEVTDISILLKVAIPPGFPEIRGYREGDTVKVGDILTLVCIVRSDDPREMIIWYRNDIMVDDSYSIRGLEVKNEYSFRIYEKDDNAIYRCEATTGLMQQPKIANVTLTVQYNPVVSLKSVNEKIYLKDQKYSFECHVESNNFTRIWWRWQPIKEFQLCIDDEDDDWETLYNDDELPNREHMVTFANIGNQTSWISHLNVTAKKSGCYMCVTSNSVGRNRVTVPFNVEESKKTVLIESNMQGNFTLADPGTHQEFFCYADGIPFPSVKWRKNGDLINASNIRFTLTDNNQKLTIRRIIESDAGFYECDMGNEEVEILRNVTLHIRTGNKESSTEGQTVFIVSGVFGVIIILSMLCVLQKIWKNKKRKKELDFLNYDQFERGRTDILNPNLPLETQIDLLPYRSKWEFPKDRLKFGKTLGHGAFARVVKAKAIGLVRGEASTTVAVKMLKQTSNNEQRKALIAELKILVHIGKHLNIVNLLGAVTTDIIKGDLYVIVEYCCHGNLRDFLLKNKDKFINQLDHCTGQLDTQNSPLTSSSLSDMQYTMVAYYSILGIEKDSEQFVNYVNNIHDQVNNDSGTEISGYNPSSNNMRNRYSKNSATVGHRKDCGVHESAENDFISTCDLLCFSFQCARGMEYLASKKLIHRDLAARNVLLAKYNVVKICDFGLAKNCCNYSNYVKKSKGLLPIKWMAIESIESRVFSSKSDVWSFGILLWEIFTLGGSPYPGIEMNKEFFKELREGYRMEKPQLALDTIYQLMKNCWLNDPNQRPEFSSLVDNIGALLEASAREYYMELNIPYQAMNEKSNDTDYVQMSKQNEEEYTNMEASSLNQSIDIVLNAHENMTSACFKGIEPIQNADAEIEPLMQLESISVPLEKSTSQQGNIQTPSEESLEGRGDCGTKNLIMQTEL